MARTCSILAALVAMFVLAGCRDDTSTAGMEMRPGPPTTRPNQTPDVADEGGAVAAPSLSYVTLVDADGRATRHEFPPAKLFLQADGPGRVKARLFSDDPAEATAKGYAGSSFFFEMRLTLPPETAGRVDQGGAVRPEDVADAEWTFSAAETGVGPSSSLISLSAGPGVTRNLRPRELFVTLRPMEGNFVDILLLGDFTEAPDASPSLPSVPDDENLRAIHVRAVLVAESVTPRP